ncbi:helix-turn-helix domain-containing protein [Agrilactobacillus yilanensis]|uniref:Helix-turn-helix domain-containing protein n=1 Tax=Agrilactobacillus yilanensis TaxID=2485997 RepID=A0ABW4J4T4_9LACO|nr:helix-turn-helix transcriptional regulator [Agrilactobacillus yilanensis]
MLNIQLFIDRRHELGLSQQELCSGICTQSTLSKFENNSKVPAMKILIQLCERLNLALADIFSDTNSEPSHQKQLETAEFSLITAEYRKIQRILNNIDERTLANPTDKLTYHYLKGYLSALSDFKPLDALFEFNYIFDLDAAGTSIYTQLAYVGCGLVYSKQGQTDKAEYYFDKVLHQVYQIPATDNRTIGQVISLMYYSAQFYASIKDYDTSNQLLQYAYKLCIKYHVTYYLARFMYLRAQNGVALKIDDVQIADWLNQAYVFARFNHNQNLLKDIEILKDTLKL